MNRHRANWSLMGIEPSTEQSQLSKDYEKLRIDLNLMVNRFGFDEVVKEAATILLDYITELEEKLNTKSKIKSNNQLSLL